eukprot:Hpha_TRINITY_DN7993_c0_g2::TRINITY_DN7993_c0_g2_i1::g.146104::m.146104
MPLLRESDFCDRECGKAGLLLRDNGYLRRAGDGVFEVTREYITILDEVGGVDKSPAKPVEIANRDAETERVIIKDVVRAFDCDDHRAVVERFLNGCFIEFGNYAQGMAHVAGLLLLTLEEDEVVAILRKINTDYIRGHWRHEAVGFATDAYVFRHVCLGVFPDVVAHLDALGLEIGPEYYCRKWFQQLFLHRLDIEHWYVFFGAFLKNGFAHLIAMGLSVVGEMKDKILATKDVGILMDLLAIEPKMGVTPEDGRRIVDLAGDYLEKAKAALGNQEELHQLRNRMYDTHLRERMEKVAAAAEAAEDDQDEVEKCPFSGEKCGRKVKYVIVSGDDDVVDATICEKCESCAKERGCEIEEW